MLFTRALFCVPLSLFHSVVHKHPEEEDVKMPEGGCFFVLVNLFEVMSPIWFVVHNPQVKNTQVFKYFF